MRTPTFDATTTARQVLATEELTGRTAIVTGGASGLGIEVARALAEAGVHVTLAVRNPDLAQAAVLDIGKSARGGIDWQMLDLADFASVLAFAERWNGKPLDMLIANAGVMACPQAYTADGLEMQVGTNHFGHYLLAVLLGPALENGAAASGVASRVVAVSSGGHHRSAVRFDDIHYRHRPYDRWEAYGQSKAANALFAVAFDARYRDRGVRAFSVAPGRILTPLQRHMSPEELSASIAGSAAGLRTAEQGASTIVYAAASRDLHGRGGLYLFDCAEAPPHSAEAPNGVAPHAIDPVAAERLWEVSVQTTGV